MEPSIFADVPSEGTSLDEHFGGEKDKQEPTPAESQPKKEEEGDSAPTREGKDDAAGEVPKNPADEEKNLPFNQHPRFKELIDQNKSLKEEIAKFNEWKQSVEQKLSKPAELEAPPEMAPWFVKLYGDSPEAKDAWAQYLEWDESRKSSIGESLRAEQQRVARESEEETIRWNKWVDDELAGIATEHKVDFIADKHLKSEFVKFVLEYRPTDSDGNFDLKKGWALFDKVRSSETDAKSVEKKKAAAAVGSDKSSVSTPKMSTKDIRRLSWGELAHF
jgi:hypothetical protein